MAVAAIYSRSAGADCSCKWYVVKACRPTKRTASLRPACVGSEKATWRAHAVLHCEAPPADAKVEAASVPAEAEAAEAQMQSVWLAE